MREITHDEVYKLKECLEALAAYHNEVSRNFKGFYPSRSYDKTMVAFEDELLRNCSYIAVT